MHERAGPKPKETGVGVGMPFRESKPRGEYGGDCRTYVCAHFAGSKKLRQECRAARRASDPRSDFAYVRAPLAARRPRPLKKSVCVVSFYT